MNVQLQNKKTVLYLSQHRYSPLKLGAQTVEGEIWNVLSNISPFLAEVSILLMPD